MFDIEKNSEDKFIEKGNKYLVKGAEAKEDGKDKLAIDLFTSAITNYKKAKLSARDHLSLCYDFRSGTYQELEQYHLAIIDRTACINIMRSDDKSKVADQYMQRGILYGIKDDDAKAIADYTKAISIYTSVEGYETDTEIQKNLAAAYSFKGILNDDDELAIHDFTKAIECYKSEINDSEIQLTLAEIYEFRGNKYGYCKKHDEAVADYTLAEGIYRAIDGYLQDVDILAKIAYVYHCIGSVYYDCNKNDLAIVYHTKAIDQYCAIEAVASNVEIRQRLADSFSERADAFDAMDKPHDSLADYTEAIAIYESIQEDPNDQSDPPIQEKLALNYLYRGLIYVELECVDEAHLDLDKAEKGLLTLVGSTNPLITDFLASIDNAKNILAEMEAIERS